MKIIELAEQMGYQPDFTAKTLVSKKKPHHRGGLAQPGSRRLIDLVTLISQKLTARSYHTLLSINPIPSAIALFNRFRVDGILVFDTARHSGEEETALVSNVPLLTFGEYKAASAFPGISVNRTQAICRSVEYLYRLAHRKIAYIGDINGNIANQDEKFSGYLQAVTELGINPITVHTNKLSWQEGFSSAMKLLQSGGRPTAIVSGSYELTVGILQAVKECSLRIPQDMSLISYDNIPQMADLDIPVTSTGIPVNQIAQNMVDSILSLIEGSQTIPSFQDIEAVIKERSSCAPPVQPGRP